MKCPFCAEVIQDAAVRCRFCGATRAGDDWSAPTAIPGHTLARRRQGTFTIRSAGVLFLISAVLQLYDPASKVVLFGALRAGAAAITYHLFLAALFGIMGAGLLATGAWGYRALMIGTLVYTLDVIRYLLDFHGRQAELVAAVRQAGGLVGVLDPAMLRSSQELLSSVTVLVAVVTVLCWWGFAFYVYRRRAYFLGERASALATKDRF